MSASSTRRPRQRSRLVSNLRGHSVPKCEPGSRSGASSFAQPRERYLERVPVILTSNRSLGEWCSTRQTWSLGNPRQRVFDR